MEKPNIDMAHKHLSAVQQALALIEATKHGIAAILNHPELQAFRTRINADLTRAGAALQGITGAYVVGNPGAGNPGGVEDIISSLQPLNTIGGEPIGRALPLRPEDTSVGDDAKDRFIEQRAALQQRFGQMTDDQVYSFMKQPDGKALVRSVAKIAGHPQWKSGEITREFLQEVRDALAFNQQLTDTIGTAAQAGERGVDQEINPEDDSLGDGTPNASTGAPHYGDLLGQQHIELGPEGSQALNDGQPVTVTQGGAPAEGGQEPAQGAQEGTPATELPSGTPAAQDGTEPAKNAQDGPGAAKQAQKPADKAPGKASEKGK